MPPAPHWRAFGDGAREASPFLLVVAPFGALFGLAATEAGLDLAQVMVMTMLVIAGAAQFTALALMEENAPVIIILASALAVNMRMAMYSAALAPVIGRASLWKRAFAAYLLFDQTYALSALRADRLPEETLGQRVAFYFGTALPVAPVWCLATLAGALGGQMVPAGPALDFALPITFIALVGPALRTLAHITAAGVSVAGTLAFAALPYNSGLLVAAVLAMIAGAQVELWMRRNRP